MQNDFAEAFLYRTDHVLLGVALRPFCLWHQFVLEAIDSPYAGTGAARPSGDPGESFAEIYTLAALCSAGYDPALSCFAEPRHGDVTRRDRAAALYFLDPAAATAALACYLADFRSAPEFLPARRPMAGGSGAAAAAAAPRALSGWSEFDLTLAFLGQVGYRGRDAWELPYGEARWRAAGAQLAANPALLMPELVSDAARRAMAEVARRRAEAETAETAAPAADPA